MASPMSPMQTVLNPSLERLALLVGGPLLVAIFARDVAVWIAIGDFSTVGMDLDLYLDAARSWLAGGPFYQLWQLAGPYTVVHGAILYPPPILLLLVPFTVLPEALWWVISIGIVAAVCAYHRPRPVAWLGIVLCLAVPATATRVVHGNPSLWVTTAVALGTIWGWPAVAAFLKPTLAPFGLIGIRRRPWWIAAVGLLVISLAFLPMWGDYLTVARNARDGLGLLYSIQEVPMVCIPVLAWLGGRHAPTTVFGREAPGPTTGEPAGSTDGEGRSTQGAGGHP